MRKSANLSILALSCLTGLGAVSFFTEAAIPNTIPKLSMVEHAAPDLDSLKNDVINEPSFINSLFLLGHHLGYAWAGGTASQYVGQDIDVRRESSNEYSLKARYNGNDPYAGGYRASERLKVNLQNIHFVTNPQDLQLGSPQVYDREAIYTAPVVIYNWGETEDTGVATLNYDYTTSWAKTDNFSFSETIGVTNKYEVGIPGLGGAAAEIRAEFSATQGWSETDGNSTSISAQAQYRALMPPRSKRYVSITLFKQKADVPYTSRLFMMYDIKYENFLRWGGNAHIDHPTNRPNFPYTFGGANANNLNGPEALVDQYLHQDINGYGVWDWPAAINSAQSKNNFEWQLASIIRKHGAPISGKFTAIDSSQFNVDASESFPLTAEDIANRPLIEKNLAPNRSVAVNRMVPDSNIQIEVGDIENNDIDGLIKRVSISKSGDVMLNN
ncbi:Aerolysin/hemolysin/leukocidin toxin [Shewanella denitrificans OS217]|uniref:Aerolysin/hemolysin/leukocidin toxin n=1 Tax=Shewanella denitrificans (strain OS217 / ATCC BAA-1090 / DSM 15013) TaxID=318161 RepID=Q12LY8_SHEDO|nr:aerolysin family beta-barrel pore-forming toxin [Shewanella denitrificans]ABE55538.1 Aerolysin/hemolysin/leukocidin toxin [Shewanella denitrificans OS217]